MCTPDDRAFGLARPGRPHRRLGAWIAIVLTLALMATGVGAQTDEERLEELKREREELQELAAAKAVEVDVASATYTELADALEAVNALVDLQEARLADAHQALASAESLQRSAEAREAELVEEIGVLAGDLSDLAVASFTGEDGVVADDLSALLLHADPTEAARRQSLLRFQTGNLADGLEHLRRLNDEAELVSAQRAEAVASAQEHRAEAETRAVELADAKAAQQELVADAAARMEARLAEAAFLAEQDAAKAAEIRRQEAVIAERLRREALIELANNRPDSQPPPITNVDIVNVQGIYVHRSIAGDLGNLLDAARADGINLAGWGFRDPVKQVELRVKHCGDSDYAIWEMPAAACNPPTARPGMSMHERGLAVDFTYNGASMTSRQGAGFIWLQNHAHRFGFVNLPSEPWHWSNSG